MKIYGFILLMGLLALTATDLMLRAEASSMDPGQLTGRIETLRRDSAAAVTALRNWQLSGRAPPANVVNQRRRQAALMLKELADLEQERTRRVLLAGVLVFLGGVSLLYMLLSLPGVLRRRRGDARLTRGRVELWSPDEAYVEENHYRGLRDSLYQRRSEALEAIRHLIPLSCGYCHARLDGSMMGKVWRRSYFKKVPNGAVDKRILLGRLWVAEAETSVRCPSCEAVAG